MRKARSYKKLVIAFISAGVLVIAGLILFFVFQGRQQQNVMGMTIAQSSVVERGDISSAIEGTGSLAVADSLVIQMPKGLVVEKIKVQNGQAIKAGDVIATVTKASVASELLTVREQLDEVEESIEELDEDEVADTTSVEYLEKLVLEAELAELQNNEKLLNEIMATGNIVAPTAGTIADLVIVEGSSIEAATTSNANSNNSPSANSNGASFMSTSSPSISSPSPLSLSLSSLSISSPQTNVRRLSTGGSGITTATMTTKAEVPAEEEITPTVEPTTELTPSLTPSPLPSPTAEPLPSLSPTPAPSPSGLPTGGNTSGGNTVPGGEGVGGSGNTTPTTGNHGSTNGGGGVTSGSAGMMGGMAGGSGQSMSMANAGTTTGTSGNNGTQATTSASSQLTTIATIGNSEIVAVDISVDELDILTVKEGQGATITLDALEGEVFAGTVKTISSEASQGDSSAKYTVGIEMSKTDKMLIGMSAAATINVEEVKDILMIPVNALQESGDRIFVYTSADENGNLSGAVDVTTGLSDGSQVEILSGLNEGDTVYYVRVVNNNSNNSSGGGMSGFGGGRMPSFSGGGMPMGRVTIGSRSAN